MLLKLKLKDSEYAVIYINILEATAHAALAEQEAIPQLEDEQVGTGLIGGGNTNGNGSSGSDVEGGWQGQQQWCSHSLACTKGGLSAEHLQNIRWSPLQSQQGNS